MSSGAIAFLDFNDLKSAMTNDSFTPLSTQATTPSQPSMARETIEKTGVSRAIPYHASSGFNDSKPGDASSDGAVTDVDSFFVVKNSSRKPHTFMIFPGTPLFTVPENPTPIYTGVYQSSLQITALTGSITFIIRYPDASVLQSQKQSVIVVTGRAKSKPRSNNGKYMMFPTDVIVLDASDGSNGSPGPSSCIMTMPIDSEPSFVKDDSKGIKAPAPQSNVPIDYVRVVIDSSFGIPDAGTCKLCVFTTPCLALNITWTFLEPFFLKVTTIIR